MWSSKSICVFVGWFMLGYGLLVAPWPKAKELYSGYFRVFGKIVFATESGARLLRFEPLENNTGQWPKNFDTIIILANRNSFNAKGEPEGFILTVDAWQMGWVPTAFLFALIFATPICWRQKWRALLWGWFGMQIYVGLTLGLFIGDESTRLAWFTLSPFWKTLANQLENLALDPVGPGFAAAIFIWVWAAFGRQDLPKFKTSDQSGAEPWFAQGDRTR